MRLLHRSETGEFILSQDFTDDDTIPRYAILSHTWTEGQEVTFQEMLDGTGQSKTGYEKIRFCGQRAASDGLRYFWVDTCCIDKSSSAELTEAINSMFRWYQKAERCYVYLPDVSTGSLDDGEDTEFARRWKPLFRRSRWFSRGWTLQELIAPASVEFFSKEGQLLGNKRTLEQTLHEITRIAVPALQGGKSLSRFSVKERMSWAKSRQTKRAEDKAYCLLGIFGIQMPLIYGEGQESALVRLQRKIEKTLKDKPWSKNEKERQLLLSSLRFDQLDSRHANIKNAHTKTCEWLLKQSEYLDWLDPAKLDQHHGFLWIKGNPGTGKSTLMKYAFSTARRTMKDWIVISFFFSARGADLEKSTIGTYQSLLLQLLERIPALQDVFDLLSFSVSIASTTHQWSIEELKTLLEEAVQGLGENPVMCFIDALDECEEDQIRDMISFFERIGEITVSAGIKFQVCFSSRHYPHVNIRNNLELVLDGQEGHSQDITNYIDSELKVGRSRIAEQTRKELQEKASGIFMWVVLVVGILNKEYDGGRMHALQRRLREIPGDLHELLRDILTRDSRDQHELILCVQWVLFARQPLSPEELYFAVLSGVEPDALSRWEPDEIPMDVMKRFVLSSSKGLVEITKTNSPKAQFIHESVKDLLIKGNGLVDIWPDLGHNFEGQSHERLKHCSLNYINIGILTPLAIPNNLPKASCQEAADLRQLATGAFPFLEYAVHNVLYHAEAAGKRGITQESFINDFPLIHWIKLVNLLAAYEEIRHSEDMSLLYVLAERNMTNLIKAHPSILAYLEVGNERYGPPLLAALRTGSREAVRMFLEAQMADQPLQGRLRELYGEYCHKGSRQSGFGSHFNFTQHRTVPSYLLEAGESEIFTFLLEAGQIDVKPKDGRGRTTLSWAAER
ncbi:HET-domain-containing protein [Byssothecium circinans]|uniref:HET-domain-containing protein n=1 Tax=Byssothecium circinans TaxID=147558 RepID=A0A6A5UEH7_9PLEO|nr:HET-domain-containing protein [Byssothecium circinans]